MDRLKNLDIRGITAEAAARIGGMALEKRTGGWNRRPVVTPVVVTPGLVQRHLLSSVWAGCLDALAGRDGAEADGAMTAELALAELIRRGVPRESVRVREGSFRLRLENSEYRIYRRGAAETVACPWPSDLWSVVRVGGECFADFLQYFDARVPEIVAEVPAILETIRQRQLEGKKAKMEREIRKTAVRSLLEQCLGPLGITAGFRLGEEDQVTLDLSRMESARLEFPLEKLTEVLRDPASVLTMLTTEPARVYCTDEDF